MKNRVSMLLVQNIFFACILAAGCSSTKPIPVRILKPAAVTMPGIKSISVIDFDVADGLDPMSGAEATRKLNAGLVANGHFEIVEGWKAKAALAELAEQEGREIAALGVTEYQKVGKEIGADAVIFGSVGIYSSNDTWEKRKREIKEKVDGKTQKRKINESVVTRTARVGITFRVVDVEKGIVLASLSKTAEAEDVKAQEIEEKSGFFGAISKVKEALGKEASPEEQARQLATANLLPPNILFDRALTNLAGVIVENIAPHYVDESRIILKGKHQLMKSGYDFAIRDLWDDSKEAWENVTENSAAASDHPQAWYNLGVYHELEGNLDEAEKSFKKAYNLKSDELYLDAKARIKKRKEEMAKLKEQLN